MVRARSDDDPALGLMKEPQWYEFTPNLGYERINRKQDLP